LKLPRDNLPVQLGRGPLRLGIQFPAERFTALPVLAQRLMTVTGPRVNQHQLPVRLFVRGVTRDQ
jgi:hypothetical protein